MDKYLNTFREMISLRGLTDHTTISYCTYIRAYLDYLTNILHKSPEDVTWDELRDYIRRLKKSRNLDDRTVNCAISQLRFFTLYVLHKTWDDTQLPMRRFDEYIPYVPSQEKTWQFISSMPDLKQKTMVTLMYSSGLRIGEVCRLRYEDVDRKNMRLHIARYKNRSDRYAILSKAALDLLTLYWFACGRPMGYLFPKQRGEDRLGWDCRLTCHSFRHAFGTHLYENGTDLLTIKELMGHKPLLSTTIYVHLSGSAIRSTVSPFDRMAGECHA